MSVDINDFISNAQISDCCGAPVYTDIGICSGCKEHCTVLEPCKNCEGTGQIKKVLVEAKYRSVSHADLVEFVTCDECEDGMKEVDK